MLTEFEQEDVFDQWVALQSDVIEAHEAGDRQKMATAEAALERFIESRSKGTPVAAMDGT